MSALDPAQGETLIDYSEALPLARLIWGAKRAENDAVVAQTAKTIVALRNGAVSAPTQPGRIADPVPEDGPLSVHRARASLTGYNRQEQEVAEQLIKLLATPAFPGEGNNDSLAEVLKKIRAFRDSKELLGEEQTYAVAHACVSKITVLTGGPGTGKTTVIVRIITALRMLDPKLHIALAAPTGKAATRLNESIRDGQNALPDLGDAGQEMPIATTLHKLLGRQYSEFERYRRDRHTPIPADVVIVDEASMLSLPLMHRLVTSLRPDARLVLVGDPDQLVSVEVGNVLGDIIEGLSNRQTSKDEQATWDALGTMVKDKLTGAKPTITPGVARLTRAHRFEEGSPVAKLVSGIQGINGTEKSLEDAVEQAHKVTDAHKSDEAKRLDAGILTDAREITDAVTKATKDGDTSDDAVTDALDRMTRSRMLCALRRGEYGSTRMNQRIQQRLEGKRVWGSLQLGGVVMATRNQAALGVLNGDTGVIGLRGGIVNVFFDRGRDKPLAVPLAHLDGIEPAYAITIHKSQGSQFDRVVILLPPGDGGTQREGFLTRELIYTGVSRARKEAHIIGDKEVVKAALGRTVTRPSGLAERLAGSGQ